MINVTKEKGMVYETDIHLESNGVSFSMLFAGNTDFYWLLTSEYSKEPFVITNDDSYYSLFEELFNEIKTVDDNYRPTVSGNVFEWYSEDFPKETASRMTLTINKDTCEIRFFTNPNRIFQNNCAVCFSNSGSNFPRIQRLIVNLYRDLLKHDKVLKRWFEKSFFLLNYTNML